MTSSNPRIANPLTVYEAQRPLLEHLRDCSNEINAIRGENLFASSVACSWLVVTTAWFGAAASIASKDKRVGLLIGCFVTAGVTTLVARNTWLLDGRLATMQKTAVSYYYDGRPMNQ